MNREENVRILLFNKPADIVADFSVRKLSLVWPDGVDQVEIRTHPLRAMRQKNVVNASQRKVKASRLFERLANLGLKSGRRSGDLNSSSRAVVSFPSVRGQD